MSAQSGSSKPAAGCAAGWFGLVWLRANCCRMVTTQRPRRLARHGLDHAARALQEERLLDGLHHPRPLTLAAPYSSISTTGTFPERSKRLSTSESEHCAMLLCSRGATILNSLSAWLERCGQVGSGKLFHPNIPPNDDNPVCSIISGSEREWRVLGTERQ